MAIPKETIDAAENEISNDLNICMVIHVYPVKEQPKKIGSTLTHFHQSYTLYIKNMTTALKIFINKKEF